MKKNNLQKILQTFSHCIFLGKENAGSSRRQKVNRTKGSILTLAVLIFATASTILGLSLVVSVVKNIQNVRGGSYSKQAFYTAEALQEDVLYRMKKNSLISTSETLSLAGAVATSTITDLPYGKKIAVISNSSDYIRKIQSIVSQTTGASFAYAIQSGSGGVVMGPTSKVNGNVYSNGSIVGANKAEITGGAISASTSASGSLISAVKVGVDAWARTVNDSNIGGNNYCQSGTGNNKNCNTSRPDPITQPFPILDETIAFWKSMALVGGTSTSLTIGGGTNDHLGPKKINGNLTVGGTLYLDGILWVTGDFALSNNSHIKLVSNYLGSGIIIVDGKTTMAQGSDFTGSGQAGSYVMVLSTSDCDGVNCGGANAILVSNNAGAVILNAQKGSIYFANNGTAKAVTANKIELKNGAIIDYVVGLIDTNFTTGPMGSWDIDSWQEII